MKNLLNRFFNEKIEPVKENKDKVYSDELRVQLARDVENFLKTDVWLKVLKPYIEDTAFGEITNLVLDGTKYTNEEKNNIIIAVRLALGIRNELMRVVEEGKLAEGRLKTGIPAKQPRRR